MNNSYYNVSAGWQNSFLSVNAEGNTKRTDFNAAQNDDVVNDSLSSVGRLFHADGPA